MVLIRMINVCTWNCNAPDANLRGCGALCWYLEHLFELNECWYAVRYATNGSQTHIGLLFQSPGFGVPGSYWYSQFPGSAPVYTHLFKSCMICEWPNHCPSTFLMKSISNGIAMETWGSAGSLKAPVCRVCMQPTAHWPLHCIYGDDVQSARGLLWPTSSGRFLPCCEITNVNLVPSAEAFTVHFHFWIKSVGSVFVFMNKKQRELFQSCYSSPFPHVMQGVNSLRLNKYSNVWNLSLVKIFMKNT